jgi:hypothetical protein
MESCLDNSGYGNAAAIAVVTPSQLSDAQGGVESRPLVPADWLGSP